MICQPERIGRYLEIMRDGLRAIHDAGPGENEPTADAASAQPAAGRGGNGTYDLSADDRRARHLSRRNGHSPVPADRSLPRQALMTVSPEKTRSSNIYTRGAGTGAGTGSMAAKDEAAVLAASGHLTDRDREANPPGSQAPRIDHRAARRARVRRRDHCQASAHTGASKVNHAVAA